MRTRLLWLLPTLMLCTLFVSLGFWQKGRGDAKQLFVERFDAALDASPMEVASALTAPVTMPRPVEGVMQRVWTGWLMLDNARHGEHMGVRVHGVYRADNAQAVLVDFGWLAQAPDRRLPSIDPPPATLRVQGILLPLPGQGIRLGRNPVAGTAVEHTLLAYLDLDELAQDTGLTFYDGVLRLSPENPVGFIRDSQALPNTLPPEKHYGYALQWFGFAAALLVIYLVLAFRKRPS